MPRKRKPPYAQDPRIPDKQYLRIGEAAKAAGVETHVLRFWETEFPSLSPAKNKGNRRVYSREDMCRVLEIRDLLYEQGYTIAGARQRLEEGPAEPAPTPARTRHVLQQIRDEVQELLRLVQE